MSKQAILKLLKLYLKKYNLIKTMGVDHWTIEFKVEEDGTENYATCSFDIAYHLATINLNPTMLLSEKEVLTALIHELAHLSIAE